MPGGVQIPLTGNFPGDMPPQGIPAQPNQNIGKNISVFIPKTLWRTLNRRVFRTSFFRSPLSRRSRRQLPVQTGVLHGQLRGRASPATTGCPKCPNSPRHSAANVLVSPCCKIRRRNGDHQFNCLLLFLIISSLYFYYDCLSKLVIQYCRDASPMVVNLVMPENRRREMAINCRSQTRDQCNKAANLSISAISFLILPVLLVFEFLSNRL